MILKSLRKAIVSNSQQKNSKTLNMNRKKIWLIKVNRKKRIKKMSQVLSLRK